MYSNNNHIDFKNYFGKNFVNFDRKQSVSTKKSTKSKKEILGLKINLPVNNSITLNVQEETWIVRRNE